MSSLSVTVITRNEASQIRDCLATVKWADEIVIVDSGSVDGTVEIGREFTEKVFVGKWEGFARAKNHAVSMASGPWILSIDADERVSPQLASAIRDAVAREDRRLSHLHERALRQRHAAGSLLRRC